MKSLYLWLDFLYKIHLQFEHIPKVRGTFKTDGSNKNVQLRVSATEYTTIGLLAVDEAIFTLRNYHRLTQKKVSICCFQSSILWLKQPYTLWPRLTSSLGGAFALLNVFHGPQSAPFLLKNHILDSCHPKEWRVWCCHCFQADLGSPHLVNRLNCYLLIRDWNIFCFLWHHLGLCRCSRGWLAMTSAVDQEVGGQQQPSSRFDISVLATEHYGQDSQQPWKLGCLNYLVRVSISGWQQVSN